MRSPRTSPNGDCRLCNKSAMVGRWGWGRLCPVWGKEYKGTLYLLLNFAMNLQQVSKVKPRNRRRQAFGFPSPHGTCSPPSWLSSSKAGMRLQEKMLWVSVARYLGFPGRWPGLHSCRASDTCIAFFVTPLFNCPLEGPVLCQTVEECQHPMWLSVEVPAAPLLILLPANEPAVCITRKPESGVEVARAS